MADDYLTNADLAQLLGVQAGTIRFFRTHSKPGGRYAADPFPAEDITIARSPAWKADRADEIKAWNARRPGQGAGGGRKTQDPGQPEPTAKDPS
jgi:hypothetical protein